MDMYGHERLRITDIKDNEMIIMFPSIETFGEQNSLISSWWFATVMVIYESYNWLFLWDKKTCYFYGVTYLSTYNWYNSDHDSLSHSHHHKSLKKAIGFPFPKSPRRRKPSARPIVYAVLQLALELGLPKDSHKKTCRKSKIESKV